MDLPPGWETGTVVANGIGIHYFEAGDGDPILMAHGMYDDGRRWIPLGSDLADRYRVIAYDARGHGQSDAPTAGYDIENRVADLVGLVEGLALQAPILLGHSMGAATCAWAAATYPKLPRGLVLVDPAWFREKPSFDLDETRSVVRRRIRELSSKSRRELRESLASEFACDIDHARWFADSSRDCSEHIAMLVRDQPLVRDALEEIECPTLILRRDVEEADRDRDRDAASGMANGQIVHVEGAGHYVFLTAYAAAFAEVESFLAEL